MRDPRAAYIMGDLLASTLIKAYENNRLYLFGWERDACLYIWDVMEAGEYDGVLWTSSFLRLNIEAIKASKSARMDYNLRAARLASESHNATPQHHQTATSAEKPNETD